MVKQQTRPKTSSSARKRPYDIHASLRYDWCLPNSAEIELQMSLAGQGVHSWSIDGELGHVHADAAQWRRPPHIELANLPLAVVPANQHGPSWTSPPVDPEAARAFVKRYGALQESVGASNEQTKPLFHVNSREFTNAYNVLRKAWGGGEGAGDAIEKLQKQAKHALEIRLGSKVDGLELLSNNLWGLITVLFLRDYAAGKIGRCANPDCPAAYFLKSRKTQKICEAGDCVAWAQRQFALKWWHENKGTKTRTKQSDGSR
jgi:hypothetical protein